MEQNNVILSIICTTYNHERYIKYALDGILIQKTKYRYEVLIGEDHSTDNSKGILEEYEKNYPGRFIVFYRETNWGAARNYEDLHSRAIGKYEIILETDDFWIDPQKLEREIDYLESHPECNEVAHRCIVVDENNVPLGLKYPECDRFEYSLKMFRRDILPGQNTTIVFRNYYKYDLGFPCNLVKDSQYNIGPGDYRRAFTMVSSGSVVCFPEIMSAYRLVVKSGSSFSAKRDKNPRNGIIYRKLFVDFSHKYLNNSEALFTAEYVLLRDEIVNFLKRNGSVSFLEIRETIKQSRQPIKLMIYILIYLIKYFVSRLSHNNKRFKNIDVSSSNELLKKFYFYEAQIEETT